MRELFHQKPALTHEEIAFQLAKELGHEVKPNTVSKAISRQGWRRDAVPGGDKPAMPYKFEEALGPFLGPHKSTHDYYMLSAYERVEAGQLSSLGYGREALAYVARKRHNGLVATYSKETGWAERPALPWELEAEAYYAQPEPEYPALELEAALRDPPDHVTSTHLRFWRGRLQDLRSREQQQARHREPAGVR